MTETHEEQTQGPQPSGVKVFFKKHGAEIGLAALVIYLVLLAVGVFAEVFKMQWILDWWIFQPPSR